MKQDLPQRTKEFALRIIRMFGSLLKNAEAQVLGKQLLLARKVSVSVQKI
jgi:hypothetical protein